MAMCSIVDTIGIVNSVVPIAVVISRKLYVWFSKVVENGGGANGGKPCPIVPETLCLLFAFYATRYTNERKIFSRDTCLYKARSFLNKILKRKQAIPNIKHKNYSLIIM